jgi:serine/threonine protein kinase
VHAHLAVTPTAIEALHPHVPRMVSAIIAKQLAKHPEERYQSAYGLRQDLEACCTQPNTPKRCGLMTAAALPAWNIFK